MAGKSERDVERFAERLEGALGDDLVAAVLYGSAARGTYVKGRSDMNVLVVLRDASAEALRPAAPILARLSLATISSPTCARGAGRG